MTRLLTLTGAGGSGKTRLALEAARELVGTYPEGVWLVELAGLSDPELVPQEVADVLGVREQPGRLILDALAGALREKKLLLVLDNCEHLVDAAAHLVDTLLGSCPGLKILATSREALDVTGEANWRVPSLSLPDPERPPTVEELSDYESARLFLERARYRDPTFVLTPRNVPAVVEICRRLEGIPLAIELAAARVGTLTAEQISERLDNSLKLLTGGGRTAQPRHQTLRGTLDWSYELLSEPEKELFEGLSVFAGGWTLEVAEAVGAGGGIEEEDVLDLLSRLVDKSLVVAGTTGEGEVRYRMLEPVRQYAREKLEESGEAEQTRRRHAGWYLGLAEEAEKESNGPGFQGWLDRLETEHDNLRAALGWALDEGDAELGLRLTGALWLFWYSRGHLGEGQGWLERAISRSDPGTRHARAKALKGAGWLALFQDEYEAAKALLEESLALSRKLGDEESIASSLTYLGFVAVLGDRDDLALPALLEEALGLKPKLKDRRTIGNLLVLEGLLAASRGDLERAAVLHEEGLALFRDIRDTHGMVMCLTNLGFITLAQTNYERASTSFREGLHLARELDHKVMIQYSFFGLAAVATAQGQPARAARLWGAAEGMHEAYGIHLTPLARSRTNYEGYLATARSQFDEAAFLKAWAEGKTMATEQAIEYALSEEEPAAPPAQEPLTSLQPVDLTRRERVVTELVARGLTNRQIASELTLSKRTVDNHVANILKKLNLTSRSQVAAWLEERRPHGADPG